MFYSKSPSEPVADELDPESEQHLRRIERRYENYAERTAFVVRLYFSAFSTLAAVLSHLGGRSRSEMIEQLVTIGIYACFCTVMYVFLGRTRKYHPTVKYVSSFIDIALLTLLTWITTQSQKNPTLSYFTPMTLIFYVFLTMSAVRNRLRVIAFTLVLSVCGYGGLMIAAYPEMRALNLNLAAASEQLIPAMTATGGVFKLPSGRPMGIVLRLLYMSVAGGLLLYAVYGARRTARQQMAYLLEQKAIQHAEIDRIKSNFFLNMSHEFRTPLTLILGPIERLLNVKEGLSTANRNELLQLVLRSGRSMLSNVNNLLDFSRLSAGKLSLQKKTIDLAAHVRSLADAFQFESERKGLQLILDLPDLPLPGTVDPYLLERALSNLIANAVRFTSAGTVTIRLKSMPQNPENAIIQIQDTGSGIAESRKASIFERFETGTTSGGSGLGLPLTREIVELHGGRIHLESDSETGTCFTIEVPVRSDENANQEFQSDSQLDTDPIPAVAPTPYAPRSEYSAHQIPPDGAPADILLVEDHSDMREFIAGILEPYYIVRSVPNGRAALEDVRRRRPDLIIADIMMPEMNGLLMLEMLRAERETADLPVILLTARSEPPDRIEGLRTGADAYLTKPFVAEELLQRAHNLIQRARAVEANLARERHQIYNDLHDNLGARLTDLAMQARRLNPNILAAGELERFNATVSGAHQCLRKALSDSEDLERMRTDFPLGLQLFLVRRYTDGGRSLDWQLNPEAEMILKSPAMNERLRHALFAILREIVTNDLKYGHLTSRLEFDHTRPRLENPTDSSAGFREAKNMERLQIRFHAASNYTLENPSGRGTHTIAERVGELGGQVRHSLNDGVFQLTLDIPITQETKGA